MQPASTAETAGGRIGLVVADAFAREDFRESLQLIADGVRDIAGFDVAAVSVLRDNDEFEFIAVSGDDDARNTLLGQFTPRRDVMADLDHAEDWGRFRFLPAGTGWRTELTWIPEVDYPVDAPNAWHPENLLSAPLCDEDGSLIGLLGVDLPHDGQVPDAGRRAVLELYAAQAERVLVRAVRVLRQSEQLRLADAARGLVRRAASSTDVEELIAECEPVLLDAFKARGLLIQVFEEDPADSTKSIVGVVSEVPDDLGQIAVQAAHLCWATQRVGVVSTRRSSPDVLTAAQTEVVLEFLGLIGRSSILLAPLGAGPECFGVVAFTRSPQDEEWTDVEMDAALDLGQDLGRVVANARTFARDRQLVAKLQELDRYKQHLIATITHELKTPLTTIRGHLELLEDTQQLDEHGRSSVAALQRGSARLMTLVEDLLLLSRVSGAAPAPTVEPVDLRALVAEAADLLGVQATGRGVTLMSHLPADAVVDGAASELQLLVTNLVGNAVKYTADGGRVDVTLTPADEGVVLTVQDTGIGISEADQERLFEEFYRSPDPAAQQRPGTGLGLAIVAQVVERAGGTISVESAPGAGSTFSVVLPSAPQIP